MDLLNNAENRKADYFVISPYTRYGVENLTALLKYKILAGAFPSNKDNRKITNDGQKSDTAAERDQTRDE